MATPGGLQPPTSASGIGSKVLGHETDTGGGAQVSSAHYDPNEYMSEKRAALRAWETLLLGIVRRDKPVPGLRPCVHRTAMFGLEVANDMEADLPPALRGLRPDPGIGERPLLRGFNVFLPIGKILCGEAS